MAAGIELDGASDHGVSEALYLRDYDQNGVELYWDKPREQWPVTPDGRAQHDPGPARPAWPIGGAVSSLEPASGVALAGERRSFDQSLQLGVGELAAHGGHAAVGAQLDTLLGNVLDDLIGRLNATSSAVRAHTSLRQLGPVSGV